MNRVPLLLLLLLSQTVSAHVSSSGFLTIHREGQTLTGSMEIAVRDAELAVGLDTNHDGRITWGELRTGGPALAQYVAQHLSLGTSNSTCPLAFQAPKVNERVDGSYAWLPFTASCGESAPRLLVRYTLMEGLDTSHRGLLSLTSGTTTQTAVLGGKDHSSVLLTLNNPDRWRMFGEYLRAGVEHILSGIDHLLFLVSLLLPAVLFRDGGRWFPVVRARPAVSDTLKIVTAFTFAHSITLTLAALGIVRLPSRLTESIIAASIIVAALNNIVPVVTRSRAWVAFAFGLLHGFGFASVLAEMGLPSGAKSLALFAFNLGIETGQLAVVLAVMPVVYRLKDWSAYRNTLMPWASASIVALASVWLVERVYA